MLYFYDKVRSNRETMKINKKIIIYKHMFVVSYLLIYNFKSSLLTPLNKVIHTKNSRLLADMF